MLVTSPFLFSSICFSVVHYIFLTFISMFFLLYSTTKVKPEGSTVVLFSEEISRASNPHDALGEKAVITDKHTRVRGTLHLHCTYTGLFIYFKFQ